MEMTQAEIESYSRLALSLCINERMHAIVNRTRLLRRFSGDALYAIWANAQ